MSEDYPTISERFQKLKEDIGADDITTAVLLLADSIERAGWPLNNLIDSTGNLNVRVSGDIATSQNE